MKSLKNEIRKNADLFEDRFWELAEAIGYKKSLESADLLVRVYLPIFLNGCDEDEKRAILENHPAREGNEIEKALGRALIQSIWAMKQGSVYYLCEANFSLGQARSLLGLRACVDHVMTSMASFQKTLDEVTKSGQKRSESLISKVMSDFGRKGAAAAHAETIKMKKEVVEYWSVNIEKSLSNEKAATVLCKQFPLSHRTLRDYVAEAKQNLRSTGKA